MAKLGRFWVHVANAFQCYDRPENSQAEGGKGEEFDYAYKRENMRAPSKVKTQPLGAKRLLQGGPKGGPQR
jgi:hypothetical protein